MSVLYHGSNIKIDRYLEPIKISDNEKAVFASPYKEFVLAFMGRKWSDEDLELGVYRFRTYIIEKKPKIFNKIFSRQQGYLYEVSSNGFKTDPRCGQFEKIKKTRTKISKTVHIPDVLKALKRSEIIMIRYNDLKYVHFNKIGNCLAKEFDKFTFNDLNKLPLKNICIKSKNIDYEDIRKAIYGSNDKKIKKIGMAKLTSLYKVYIVFD